MVLAINKEPVTCFYDIEYACQSLDKYDNNEGRLSLTIFRHVRIEFSTFQFCFVIFLLKDIVDLFFFVLLQEIVIYVHTLVCMIFQGHEIDLIMGIDIRDGSGTTHSVNWCWCIVQDPIQQCVLLDFFWKKVMVSMGRGIQNLVSCLIDIFDYY